MTENAQQSSDSARHAPSNEDIYELKLYVAGNNRKCQLAFSNLKEICYKYLAGKCHIKVIDLTKNPDLARADQIVAVPTLIRTNCPGKRVVGDLSNQEKVFHALDLEVPGLTGTFKGKGSVEKKSAEESKVHIASNKRSKDDLQPYIGSGLFRQQPQNLDKWIFSLPHILH